MMISRGAPTRVSRMFTMTTTTTSNNNRIRSNKREVLVIECKRKQSSKLQRKIQLREETREFELLREQREQKRIEREKERPEAPNRALTSSIEANENVNEADVAFELAVTRTREMKAEKRNCEDWDQSIGYSKFPEIKKTVSKMNRLRVRAYETRLERALFLIELAKAIGKEKKIEERDVQVVGKTLDTFDWVYGKEVVDDSNARTLEFMLRASQKKTLYDGLKAQISYEILNVAVASESISSGLMKSKDQLIEKHMKRIEKGLENGDVCLNSANVNSLLAKLDELFLKQQQEEASSSSSMLTKTT